MQLGQIPLTKIVPKHKKRCFIYKNTKWLLFGRAQHTHFFSTKYDFKKDFIDKNPDMVVLWNSTFVKNRKFCSLRKETILKQKYFISEIFRRSLK